MTKIILNNGEEEYLSPGAARKKVSDGDAVFAQAVPVYSTRQLVADTPKKEKRKRRTKAEIEADEGTADDPSNE